MSNDINSIKRPRGRPRKLNTDLDKVIRGKGRPKGSKNKPKTITNHVVISNDEVIIKSNDSIENEGGSGTIELRDGDIDINLPKISKTFSNNDKISKKISKTDFTTQSNNNNIDINKIKIDPQLVIAARQKLALSSLVDYACMIDIPDTPIDDDNIDSFSTIKLDSLADHHLLMCTELQKLVDLKPNQRTFDNIMFFMPPGSAKSTYVDVVFGSWFMAKYPRKAVILASYGDEPAQNQARKVKSLINSKDYQNLFPNVRLSRDRTAVDNFALSNGSSFLSRGLFGEITSRRADLGIIDDPVKGAEDADSEVMQKKSWQAYERNFCTRLKPGAPQVMIMTRWNENDLAGRILPDNWDGESGDFEGRDGRRWRVICLPAICDREDDPLQRKIGESLWPEWFGLATGDPLDHWKPFRSDPRTWASLYQQKPTAGDGIYFSRDSFKRYDPKSLHNYIGDMRKYGTSDYAVSDGKGDYTVLRIWAIDDNVDPPDLYLIDGWKNKTKSDKWIREQCKLIEKYQPLKWFGEAGAIQQAVEPSLLESMRNWKPRRLSCKYDWLPSSKAKEIRARPAQTLVTEGRVYIPEGVEYDQVIEEYVKFPAGKHDDDVDNLSLIGRVIDQITIKKFKPSKIVKLPKTITPFNRNK